MQRKRIEVSISAKSSWVLVCLSFFLCFQRLSCDDTTWIHLTSSHWWKSEVDESSNQGSCSLLLRILHSYCFPYWGFSWLAYNPGVDLKCFLKTALIFILLINKCFLLEFVPGNHTWPSCPAGMAMASPLCIPKLLGNWWNSQILNGLRMESLGKEGFWLLTVLGDAWMIIDEGFDSGS